MSDGVRTTIKIQLPAQVSLLESSAISLRKRLIALGEKLFYQSGHDQVIGVWLFSESSLSDFSSRWIKEVGETGLLAEVAPAIFEIRLINWMIKNSSVPWYFACSDDCLDSYWDLALSCDKILNFGQNNKFGYPAVEANVFPPAGNFEPYVGGKHKLSDWVSRPTVKAERATQDQLFYINLPMDNWVQNLDNWEHLFKKKKIKKKLSSSVMAEMKVSLDKGLARTQGIKQFFSDVESNQFSLINFSEKLKKLKSVNEIDRSRMMSWASAKYYLSDQYYQWIIQQYHYCNFMPKDRFENLSEVKKVYINLDQMFPPVKSILEILRHDIEIILFSSAADRMSQGLGLLYSQLEKLLATERLVEYWRKYVSWVVTSNRINSAYVVSWSVDQKVICRYDELSAQYQRSDGNGAWSELGWGEHLSQSDAPVSDKLKNCHEIIDIMFDGSVQTSGVGEGKWSVIDFIRSFVFEELVNVALLHTGGLDNVVQLLSDSGWGKAGDTDFWLNFLSYRSSQPDINGSEIMPLVLDHEILGLGLYKHARNWIQNNSQKTNDALVGAQVSYHFAQCVGLVAVTMASKNIVRSLSEADLLLAHSVGFPKELGVPSEFLKRRGLNRMIRYFVEIWPKRDLSDSFFSQLHTFLEKS